MDFWEQDLFSLLSEPQIDLTEDHALIMIYNILCGINFLHSVGIMHRDLKPANILINNNNNCEIKICDFGMSRTLKNPLHFESTSNDSKTV